MKNFKFKLWPLLKIKEIEKLKVEQKMSKVLEEINKRIREIEFNQRDIRMIIDSSSQGRSMNLLFGQDYLNHRKSNIRLLKLEIEQLEIDKNKILAELVKVEREMEKLQEMREQQRSVFKKELTKKEEASIEEISMLRGQTAIGETDHD